MCSEKEKDEVLNREELSQLYKLFILNYFKN